MELCKQYGATDLINYSTQDLRTRLKEITGGGVDVVYDPVGGDYTEPALRSMNWKGRYLVIGFASGPIPSLPMNLPLLKGCSVNGVFWGSFAEREPKANFQNVMELIDFYNKGELVPYIQKTFSLEETPQALYDMLNRKVMGKLVVVP